MSLVSFDELMAATEPGKYAVGYFESWDMVSLLAAVDAAESARSPVLLGLSGIYQAHSQRLVHEPLSAYAAFALEVCRRLSVPAALVYNESPDKAAVLQAAALGFGLVMFADEALDAAGLQQAIKEVVPEAHRLGAAVEGEMAALPGLGVMLDEPPSEVPLTDVEAAAAFVAETGIDALAVNLGQVHLHGRRQMGLDLDRLDELRRALSIPLVLHGASSVRPADLRAAAQRGIRKINVGSVLKRTYFESLRSASLEVGDQYNPYVVIGSGLEGDVLVAARKSLTDKIVEMMQQFGSAGKA